MKMKKVSIILMVGLVLSLAVCIQAKAAHGAKKEGAAGYSPYTKGYPQRVLFGDTHVHTKLSNDAFAAGVRLGPEEAYRFARGDEVISSHGEKVRMNQPLDFLVVADHAEAYGG